MWKVSVTLLLAVVICLGWTAFNAAQAAPDQRLTQRTDAHYRGYGHNPARDYGFRLGSYPRPYPHGQYYPVRSYHPYPRYYARYDHGHRPIPAGWLYARPAPRPYPYHRGY